MNTNTNTTNRVDRRDAVRALAAASLAALDGIEKAKLADIADIRAKMQDALQWGDGSRLPQSAKAYRKTQQPGGADTWWYRLDGEGEELGCVLHTVFDWIINANDRSVDLNDGMRSLREAVQYHVRESGPVVSAACAAAGYDEDRLADRKEAPCAVEARGADVVNLEDARLSRDIADVGARIDEQSKRADALAHELEAMTDLVYSALRARGAHITLVSNDVDASDSPNVR